MKRKQLSERGAVLAETALALPLFLALAFGILTLGHTMLYRLASDDAISKAVRAASVDQVNFLPAVTNAYEQRVHKFGYQGGSDSFNVGRAVVGNSCGLQISVSGTGKCAVCEIFAHRDGFSARAFVPLEDPQASCS